MGSIVTMVTIITTERKPWCSWLEETTNQLFRGHFTDDSLNFCRDNRLLGSGFHCLFKKFWNSALSSKMWLLRSLKVRLTLYQQWTEGKFVLRGSTMLLGQHAYMCPNIQEGRKNIYICIIFLRTQSFHLTYKELKWETRRVAAAQLTFTHSCCVKLTVCFGN